MTGCRFWILACATISVGGCTEVAGTETGNPTLEFDSTECKSHATVPEAAPLSGPRSTTLSLRKAQGSPPAFMNARYDGLTCFLWERLDTETLRIEITNHADGCSENEHWQPSATLNDDGTLDLQLENPSCSKALCGWCTYDLSFTVQVPSSLESVHVRLFGDSCSGDAVVEDQAQLSLGSGERGEVCGYANPHALRWTCSTGATGRYSPCSAPGDCYAEGTTCAEGLSCADLDQPRCAPACESDADCADVAATHCQDGTCRL